jgi:hypothetical protein
MLVPSIQKVKGHIIVWDLVTVPDTPKTGIYHAVSHLYISSSYYFSFAVLIFHIQFDICRPVTMLSMIE